jgi:hypothetical protein
MQKQSIDILGAAYGLRQTQITCPVMVAVKQRCEGRIQCNVTASDQLCQAGERAPAVLIATLSIRYRCFQGDKDRVAFVNRPFELRISCSFR